MHHSHLCLMAGHCEQQTCTVCSVHLSHTCFAHLLICRQAAGVEPRFDAAEDGQAPAPPPVAQASTPSQGCHTPGSGDLRVSNQGTVQLTEVHVHTRSNRTTGDEVDQASTPDEAWHVEGAGAPPVTTWPAIRNSVTGATEATAPHWPGLRASVAGDALGAAPSSAQGVHASAAEARQSAAGESREAPQLHQAW